jgi:hypothetical protein
MFWNLQMIIMIANLDFHNFLCKILNGGFQILEN